MNIGNGDDEFAAFEAAGDVEVGESQKDIATADAGEGEEEKPKPKPRGVPKMKEEPKAKPDIEVSKDGTTADEGDDDGDDDGDETDEKPKKSPTEHQINRLKREKADLARQLREARASGNGDLTRRLENLEKGLPAGNSSDTQSSGAPEPDPSDSKKYPLGHLDDRYIEDKLEWLADKKAAERADAVLRRQQENERSEAVNRQQEALLEKVDEIALKGSELFEDFQETVVEAGMRGDYDLQQPTFEAAVKRAHGAQILYELSQDTKEATRVAKLDPDDQVEYVINRNNEIAASKKGRTKPQAGDPPKNVARGANSKTAISPATNNLDDFEKAWEADEKKSR